MAREIASLLRGMASYTVDAVPKTKDGTGGHTYGIATSMVGCDIQVKNRVLIDSSTGNEVVSKVTVTWLDTDSTINVNDWVFTLPVGFASPRENLVPLSVSIVSDENGPHHTVVHL